MSAFERFRDEASSRFVDAMYFLGFAVPESQQEEERLEKVERDTFGFMGKLVIFALIKFFVIFLFF
jgi:hypothetical protein